ncbi:MAG: SPOR domain-containing protein [Rickettsiales bacterium]
MKHTRLALVLATTMLTATPALAASVTMVQFGSFETRAEAEKRLSEIATKHTTIVGKLTSTIREIKLPPDNLTVYRTQAGPLADRAAAQAVCSQLASAGDECFIVQTAMITTPTPTPATAVAEAAKPVTAPAAAAATSAVSTVATAANDTARTVTSVAPDVSARDPMNREALASVKASAATVATNGNAPVAAIETTPSPQIQAALDKAVANQPTEQSDMEILAAAEARKQSKRGFWSRLNPFSSEPIPAPKPTVAAVDPKAAPVESVQTSALEVPPEAAKAEALKVETEKVETPKIETPKTVTSVVEAPVATQQVPASTMAHAPTLMDTRPVITEAEPLRLPPPPAPLKAADRELLANAAKAPRPEPVTTGTIAPTAGTVQVEEAKRVPVTSTNTMPAPSSSTTPAAVPTAVPFQQASVALQPSATDGRKTVWAQVGPFESNDAALAYWSNYRQNNPDFPVVRVRVTSPMAKQQRGMNEAYLRIGPVSQVAFVKNLCSSLAPHDPEKPKTGNNALRCGVVTDMGLSSPLARTPGLLPASRYAR